MNAILIDDEPLALEFLEAQINTISDIQIIGKFTFLDLEKEIELINNTDIAFLDVEMPVFNGLELAERLLEIKPTLSIVFVTAFNEYAVQAFELNVLDYILKPVDSDRLEKTLKRIRNTFTKVEDHNKTNDTQLNIKLCQDLSFSTNTKENKHIQWRTSKAKEIFLYLLHHQGQTVRKSVLIDIFWSDFDLERAYSQLYTNVYHIRKGLKVFGNHFSLKSLHEGYQLRTKNISVDVIEWESKLKSLPPLNEDSVKYWEEVMNIYTGHFLENIDLLWAEAERFRLEQIWLKTAFQIANYYLSIDNIENAEKSFLKICNFRPEEEEAHFQLMKIYEKFDLGLLINHQYNTIVNISEELGVNVSPRIEQWYQSRKT